MSFVVRMVRMMSLIHHQSTSVNAAATKNVSRMGGGGGAVVGGRSTTIWTRKNLSIIVGGGLFLTYVAENTDLMTLVTHEQSTHVRQVCTDNNNNIPTTRTDTNIVYNTDEYQSIAVSFGY